MQSVAKIAVFVLTMSAFTAWWITRTQPGLVVDERRIEAVLKGAFPNAPPAFSRRLAQDETQRACTEHADKPPPAVAEAIAARARASIKATPDDKLIGDWRRGEEIAQSGYGLRFTDDAATAPNGGNCYACHRITPAEESYGTLGVSLVGYGRLRRFREADARAIYEKIYDSHATSPCSSMPRYGTNGVLTPAEIADLVALLLHPDSPVNAPEPR